MGSRSTYDRRNELLEWAIDAAVDDLPASPHAEAGDLIRIRAVQEIDFDGRHIDRLLPALAPEQLRRADTSPLHALEIARSALDARLRRVALHVPAVAEAAQLLLSPVHDRRRAPVA